MKLGLDKFGLLLHDAAKAMRKRFELRAQEFGLSAAQWRLLVHLVREGRATQTRLAELLEVEPISVSRLIDRMELGGWVLREPDATDRRVRMIVPTDRTMQTFSQIRTMAGEVYDNALSGLSENEKTVLVTALNKIIENLTGDDASSPACTGSEAKK
jgi:MarR family transcriptional regulator for hemolysin